MATTYIVTVEEMRALEASADAAGVSYAQMMETAGRAVADRAILLLSGLVQPSVLILVGAGNNGGDGLVAGRLIAARADANVVLYLLRPRNNDPNFNKVQDAGLRVIHAADDPGYGQLAKLAKESHLVIDAVLGIGTKLPLREDIRAITRCINEANCTLLLAVDIPTGMDADTGALDPDALKAEFTVTFEAAKPGHFVYPGADAVGVLGIAPLSIPEEIDYPRQRVVADFESVCRLLPMRSDDSNKGTHGKALIIGGSDRYIGAPALAARAAYTVGTGLVSSAVPSPLVQMLAANMLESTWLPLPHADGSIARVASEAIKEAMPTYNAMLLGVGLGQHDQTRAFVSAFVEPSLYFPESSRDGVIQSRVLPRLVVDADGLNLLATLDNWWRHIPSHTIVTPHPGEMARLTRSSTADVQRNRFEIAVAKAAEWNCIVLLKGAYTVIAHPDGRITVLPFANSALAKAGTGDVLAGVIVGYLAQGLDPYEAAVLGGYVHALAGEIAVERIGTKASVLASDVITALPLAIAQLEGKR
jgi:ADP-dependent NAD(P)H-hydrate dehydratase / NAD(P)H-hydrate epimerase